MKRLIVLSFVLLALSSVQAQRVETIAGFLHVYPYNLGYFPSRPAASVIANINSNAPYDFDDWRLPTRDELSLIMANQSRLSGLEVGQYISSDGHSSGFVRLVSTGRRVSERRVTEESGVVVNGVRWATRNVASPGTFSQNPEDAGMFYQWNRRRGLALTGSIANWDDTMPSGTLWYSDNDPCPAGWRVPTDEEFQSLLDAGSIWTTRNGVNGRLFGTVPNQIFLPAAGQRFNPDGGRVIGVGVYGCYWSREAPASSRGGWIFNSANDDVPNNVRRDGFSVRCVAQ